MDKPETEPASRPATKLEAALPRISVVTPTYNGGAFLEECIESVLAQAYPDLEYIVIDGGSSDESVEILERNADRLAYWISEPDDGQADAINKGFQRASGQLVCWLNADDLFYPGALAAAAEAYRADPTAPFYFGNGYRVDRDGRPLSEFFPDGNVQFRRDALVFGLNTVLQPSTFIRREALNRVGMLDTSLHFGLDTDLWIRLSELGEPRPIRRHLSASREYGETKTSTGSFTRAEELRQIAERHAGTPATPGALLYYLDTLHRVAASRPDVFPGEYVESIEAFWSATAGLLQSYGARPDGFPVASAASVRGDAHSHEDGRRKIGIELRQISRGASGGIVVVLVGTLLELFRRRPDVDFIVFCTPFNRTLLESELPNVETITLPLGDFFFSEVARVSRERQIDVLIRSYPSLDELDYPLARQIFLIPDVQHEYHPEFFDESTLLQRRRAFRTPLRGAGAIFTISEYARETIEEQATGDRQVFVASPSLPPDFVAARAADATAEERALVPSGEFFYFPANLWPHKNHDRLIEALRKLRARTGREIELVLTGSPTGWEGLRSRHPDVSVRHLGYVSPALVKLLYERTLALTFFSRYEGFGIPLLEAFSVGTPVLCSNTTSLPEVAGDAALMCDPTDLEAITDLLEQVSTDASLRASLVQRGAARAQLYTWEEAGRRLDEGIEQIVGRLESPTVGESPRVSIVTPSYNQGRFIKRTIDSVLGQTYPYIEYLVVDGASTDETVDVLRSYGDRVKWISEPDRGQTEAINKGLRRATGEILAYLNSDDVLLPDAVEKIVAHFHSHPECDLVYGHADYIDEEDRTTGEYASANYSFERMMYDCCICQPAAFWRSAVTDAVGPFDEDLSYAMDFDYWIRVDRCGFVLQHMHEKIAQSRLHPDTKTLSSRRAIYREIFDVCRKRAGFVSRSYVDGWWHHLAYETKGHPARLLRSFPRLRSLVVSAHWRLLNRDHRPPRDGTRMLARHARRVLIRELNHYPRFFRALLSARDRVRRLQRRVVARGVADQVVSGRRLRVRGYWPDNWIEQRLDVLVGDRDSDRELRIAGRSVLPMTLAVSANGTRLGEFELGAQRQEVVEFQLPRGPSELVSFVFSDHVVDPAGRRIAFLLQETNVFSEEDLAAQA